MKIEDSPYQFTGTSPLDKLRRSHQPSLDITLEDLDLSFLDLLTSVATDDKARSADGLENTNAKVAKSKEKEVSSAKETEKAPRLSLVEKASESKESDDKTQVEKDMILFKEQLTDIDRQYMKQVVIPGLPILMGTVPFQSVFPPAEDGQISYKGFDVSPKLAELIEKGYKTGRPIRVELDANSAVVLKIRNGQVSADFVSADKGATLMMQQELNDLRNRMASRNLPVGTLEYKYQDPSQSGRQSRQDDSDHESDSGR